MDHVGDRGGLNWVVSQMLMGRGVIVAARAYMRRMAALSLNGRDQPSMVVF